MSEWPWLASMAFRLGALIGWTIIAGMLWWAQRSNGSFLRALAWLTTAQAWSVAYFLLFNVAPKPLASLMYQWAWVASAPVCVCAWVVIVELWRQAKGGRA